MFFSSSEISRIIKISFGGIRTMYLNFFSTSREVGDVGAIFTLIEIANYKKYRISEISGISKKNPS